MKTIGTLLAGLLFAVLSWGQPALAQGLPPGSYLRTCGNVYLQGDTLIATCRRADGYAQQTSLPAVQSCIGDVGNANGNLTCNYAGGLVPQPYYAGAPGYGREHCWGMRERLREIRYRMDAAPPWERDRLGARFFEIRERLRNECWGHWRED